MAFSNIKGLTVQIGADTSRLGDALEDVNKRSKNLSRELSEVNRLLKLDPKNTDLLAQKQKILSDAVNTTSEKLAKLREAEEDVQQQFERGEVSEEQYRALQREIYETEQKLEGYKDAVEETYRALRGLDEDTEDAEESSGKLGETLVNVAKGGLAVVAAAAAAGAALITGLVACAEATREYRTEMGKLDTAFTTAGHSSEAATETYKTLQGVLGDTGQAVEASGHLALLCDTEEDLATWTDICTGVYATFGDSLPIEGLAEAANETAKTGSLTGALADALNWAGVSEEDFQAQLDACTTEQERQALITATLNGLYSEAADTYRETNAELIRANEANEAWTASMAAVGAVIEPILTDIKEMGAALLSDAVPGVTALVEAFRGLMHGDAGASGDFSAALTGLVDGLINTITGALPTIAQTGVTIISTLVTSLLQQIPTLLTTAGQIISQLGSSLLQLAPTLLTTAGQLISQLVTGFATNLPLVMEQGRQILTNISAGIAESLPNLLSQGLDLLMKFAQSIYDSAPTLIQTGFDVLSNLVSGIVNSLPTLIAKAPEIISTFANTINDNFPTILMKGAQLIWQIVTGIISAIPDLIANAPKIITAIVDVWEAFNWLNLGKKAITFMKDGILKMVGGIKSAGQSISSGVTDILQKLPEKLLSFGKNAVSNLGSSIRSGLSTIKSAATTIFNAVVNGLKSLPSKLLSVGKDLVKGLWNGISDMTGWIIGKIQGFGESVLSGIKSFFGIKSPSRVFRDEVGAMLAEGMAVGIEENADAPLDAMADLSGDLLDEANGLNGLTLERQLRNTFEAPAAAPGSGMLDKLNQILAAIERGQVLTIDKNLLIGATADGYDNTLGQRRALVVRGAL